MSNLKKVLVQDNGEPDNILVALLQAAKPLFQGSMDAREAAKRLLPSFPPLEEILRFSPHLGWPGSVSKRWQRFTTGIFQQYQAFINYAFEVMVLDVPEGNKGEPSGTTREDRVWDFAKEEFQIIVEDVISIILELLPELKQESELDGISKERQTFLQGLREKRETPYEPSIAELRMARKGTDHERTD